METTSPAFADVYNAKVNWDPTNNNNDVNVEEKSSSASPASQPLSVRELWREYLAETSLHGCKHMLGRRHTRLASLLWILSVLGMAGFLGFVLVELFLNYKEYPFRTVMSVRQERNISLPTFTLCLPSNIDMSKLKASPVEYDYISKTRSPLPLRSFFDTEEEMDDYLNRTKEYLSNITSTEFAQKSAFSLDRVVLYMMIDYKYRLGSDLESLLTPVPHPFDSCWKFNGDIAEEKTVSLFDEIGIMFNLHSGDYPPHISSIGLKIFAHEIHQDHVFENSLYIRPGSFAILQFSTTEHRYLPLPYRSFGDEGCLEVDSKEFQNPLKHTPRYYMMSCMLEFMHEQLVDHCGCIEEHEREKFPNVSVCTFSQTEECYAPFYQDFYVDFFLQNRFSDVGCLPECSFTTYDLSLSTAAFPARNSMPSFLHLGNFPKNIKDARENLVYLVIKAKESSVRVIEHVPEITLLSIFGTVGGFMGLFLGASLLSLLELLETIVVTIGLLITRFKRSACRESGPKHKC